MFQKTMFRLATAASTLMAAAITFAPANAQQTPALENYRQPPAQPSPGDGILVRECFVKFINKTQLPAESQGKLVELKVEEGMTIKKGDVIAVVDDKQAKLAVEQKKAEEAVKRLAAQNNVNLRDAVATEKIARAEANTYEELQEKGAAPWWDYQKKKAEADRAKLRIELAQLNEQTAMAEYMVAKMGTELAESDIEMRTITADFDAFVETRIAQLGEWVQPGTPIVELVQIDRLRVEGYFDAMSYAGQIRRGAPAKVIVTIGGSPDNPITREFLGKVDYVSTELDMDQGRRMWVGIQNEREGDDWVVQPGMNAVIEVLPAGGAGF